MDDSNRQRSEAFGPREKSKLEGCKVPQIVTEVGLPVASKNHTVQLTPTSQLFVSLTSVTQPPPKASWREDQRILDVYLLPQLEHIAARDVKRPDVRATLEKVAATGPVMANRVKACASKIFSWAASQDLIENNPCNDLERPTKEHSRDRHLSPVEIKLLWRTIDGNPQFDPLRLILITAQRPGEVSWVFR